MRLGDLERDLYPQEVAPMEAAAIQEGIDGRIGEFGWGVWIVGGLLNGSITFGGGYVGRNL